MGKYIVKRLFQMAIVLFLISILMFLMVSFLPGDPVYAIGGTEISDEEYDLIYQELDLDTPIIQRYFKWLGSLLSGDFGNSFRYKVPVKDLVLSRLPITMYLAILSLIISFPIGILFGVISAVKRGKKIDTVVTLIANLTICLPVFWVGIMLMYIFSFKLHVLPAYDFTWPWIDFAKSIKQTIMPVACLSIGGIAATVRQTRSSMLEVINQDYVRTARSKGISEKKVILIHSLKNALIPVITLIGMRLAILVGGSIFVESVFSIAGMGSLLIDSINLMDMPVIQACVLLTAFVVCISNLFIDILYAVVDPRIKFKK